MAEEKIVFKKEEFEGFFEQCTNLLLKGQDVYKHFESILMNTLPLYVSGKPFYQGKKEEDTVKFYAYYTANIGKLNSFYSKLWEYLMHVAEQMEYTDEELGKLIDKFMSAPKGGQ